MATKQHTAAQVDVSRVVPVAAERLNVGRKRVVSGHVLVRTTTKTDTVLVDESLENDEVAIERVPVDRLVDGPIEPYADGDVLVIPVLEEVAVVTRRLRLVEELRIRRRTTIRRYREPVKLRRQEAHVERMGPEDVRRTARARRAARPQE